VARRAAGELLDARDLVFPHEPLAEAGVVGGPLPRHVVDLIARTYVRGRITVTIDAPGHHQRCLLVHQRHPVDRAVTGRAPDPLLHVNAVIEVHEIRQIMDARPLERLVVAEARAHRFENRRRVPDLRVAVHARFGRRDVGERRLFYSGMAISAVDTHAADVMGVAELDGLLDEVSLLGVVPGEVQHGDDPAEEPQERQDHHDADSRVNIGVAMEKLAHRVDIRAVPDPARRPMKLLL